MKTRKGFSTVELMIVIGIIGILSVMMYSMLGRSSSQRARFNRSLNNFIGDFNFMKSKASAESRLVALVFNPNGKQYTIQVQRRIGDYGNWDPVEKRDGYVVMYDQPMFESTGVQDFAVNSMGQVFKYPVSYNDAPQSIELEFFVKKRNSELVDYTADVKIYAYGGIKSEKKTIGGEKID